jgi:hypothetical protein
MGKTAAQLFESQLSSAKQDFLWEWELCLKVEPYKHFFAYVWFDVSVLNRAYGAAFTNALREQT